MKRQNGYSYNALEEDNNYTMPMHRTRHHRFENAIEAELQDGDTLQAIALRFHCSITEIKRLNKIDKDNEIYARKTIKVPINPHSILLETLPIIHKSGQNSPKQRRDEEAISSGSSTLENDRLNEKLLVASVVTSQIKSNYADGNSINSIILNSKLARNVYSDELGSGDKDLLESLLNSEMDDTIARMRPIRGPSRGNFECSGSDCDISWICLFICILALCFAIPLVYVLYVAENKFKHDEMLAHNHSLHHYTINASLSPKLS